MRVNVYAEEMTDRVEVFEKQVEGQTFTAVRFYLELPTTLKIGDQGEAVQLRGPFIHRPGDDDSAAVTFWGKKDLRAVLSKALLLLDRFYESRRFVGDTSTATNRAAETADAMEEPAVRPTAPPDVKTHRLERFKAYVHERLDKLRIPQFNHTDCRIGYRLDYLVRTLEGYQKECDELKKELAAMKHQGDF